MVSYSVSHHKSASLQTQWRVTCLLQKLVLQSKQQSSDYIFNSNVMGKYFANENSSWCNHNCVNVASSLMWFVYTSETRVSLMHSQLYTVVYMLVFSLTSQTLSIPQHQSLLVSVHMLHAESNRHSGTEKVWLARLACVSAWSNNKLLVYMTIQLTSHTNGGTTYSKY